MVNSEDYKNQKQVIMAHLREYGTITTLESYMKYQIMRPGSVVNLLRKDGFCIVTQMEKNKNNKRYARYYLKERGNKNEIL